MMHPDDNHERISFINQSRNSHRNSNKSQQTSTYDQTPALRGFFFKCCILIFGLVLLISNARNTNFHSKSVMNEENEPDVDTTEKSYNAIEKSVNDSFSTNEYDDSEDQEDGEDNNESNVNADEDLKKDDGNQTDSVLFISEDDDDKMNNEMKNDDDILDDDDDSVDDDNEGNKGVNDDDKGEEDGSEDDNDGNYEFNVDIDNNNSGENTTESKIVIPSQNEEESGESGMKYAWLMSFPNSGTSYTLKIVRSVSNLNTATNYRKKILEEKEAEEYLKAMDDTNENHPLIPFISNDNKLKPPASGFILTKTHCGGRCSSCAPNEYLESTEVFLKNCLKMGFNVENKDNEIDRYNPTYDPALIERAVHLFRNPFDNAISRFHCHRKKRDDQYKLDFPKDSIGFHSYCKLLDEMWVAEETELDEISAGKDGLVVETNKVPCHGEFHRYIAWHENVLRIVTQELAIPTHVMHYEDYEIDYENTIEKLMNFLELPKGENRSPFYMSDYSDHFSKEEKDAAILMMKNQASDELWKIISTRYGY